MLGKGGQGKVHRAVRNSDNKVFAIKIISDDDI